MSRYNPNMQSFDPLASKSSAAPCSSHANPHVNMPPPPVANPLHMTQEQLQYLQCQGFPMGMIRALQVQKDFFPVRIWMLDNSSYMNVRDAHILRGNYENLDHVTRWEELQDCVAYHADLAFRFSMPSRYALLNNPKVGPQYFSLAQTGNLQQEQQILKNVMSQTVPNGPTPLTTQLRILREYIVSIAPQLRAKQQTVPIIIATQGLPTNDAGESSYQVLDEFVQMLRSYEPFPVCFVLRLCTDDEKAFDFYNSLDLQLDLQLDVLDDFYGEALEIYLRNPWLTYGLVLHRYREMGFRVPVLDTLDERALTLHELRDLCRFLFDIPTLPDPAADWTGFLKTIESCMARERPHWNPITKSARPWIDLAHLNHVYGQRYSFPGPQGVAAQSFHPYPQSQQQTRAQPMQYQPQTPSPVAAAPARAGVTTQSTRELVKAIETKWAKQPPAFTTTKPLAELLGTIAITFSLVDRHEHFESKFHPFSREALSSGGNDVLKRAVRKMRFFFHPDRLPRDLNDQQALLCRTLWDTISEAWDSYSASN
jgi:hypothetical protein